MAKNYLDATDCRILECLQNDARIANVDLAGQVNLSPSPCLRRVRRLEEEGFVRGYVSLLDPAAIGLPVSVFVQVSLEKQVDDALDEFERQIISCPEVMECYLMTGAYDYMVRVVVEDTADYERLHNDYLTRLPGVVRVQSSFALRTVTKKTDIPFD